MNFPRKKPAKNLILGRFFSYSSQGFAVIGAASPAGIWLRRPAGGRGDAPNSEKTGQSGSRSAVGGEKNGSVPGEKVN